MRKTNTAFTGEEASEFPTTLRIRARPNNQKHWMSACSERRWEVHSMKHSREARKKGTRRAALRASGFLRCKGHSDSRAFCKTARAIALRKPKPVILHCLWRKGVNTPAFALVARRMHGFARVSHSRLYALSLDLPLDSFVRKGDRVALAGNFEGVYCALSIKHGPFGQHILLRLPKELEQNAHRR